MDIKKCFIERWHDIEMMIPIIEELEKEEEELEEKMNKHKNVSVADLACTVLLIMRYSAKKKLLVSEEIIKIIEANEK